MFCVLSFESVLVSTAPKLIVVLFRKTIIIIYYGTLAASDSRERTSGGEARADNPLYI
jgi:hypothetical protein